MKKLISLILATTLALTLFAGCTSKEEAPKNPEDITKPISDGQIGTKENPVEVKIIAKDISETEEGVKLLAEKISEGMEKNNQFVKIKYLESPSGTYGEAVPLAIRTGQIMPDIAYFQNGDLPIAQEGFLEDLTPYIEKSTYVKSLMQDFNFSRMENYPYLLWLAPARLNVPVMRSDFINKLPSAQKVLNDPSVDNYYEMFKEIVSTKTSQHVFTADGNLTRLNGIFNHAFGVTSSFMKKDGKWISYMTSDEEKNKLEFYAKLYKEKLIDPEYITLKWDGMEQKFYEGKVAIIAGSAGGVMQIYNDKMTKTNGEGAELVVLPPAKGISQGYESVDITKEPRGFAIMADSKVKDAAFAVLEYMASPEGRMLDKLGIEGVHYNIKDGKVELSERFSEWWARFWDTFNKFPEDLEFVTHPMSKTQADSLTAIENFYKEDINVIIPENLQPKWDALNSLYKEYAVNIITGKKPISSFDEFKIKWNEIGGKDIEAFATENLK